MSRARVAVLSVISKKMSVTAAAAEYGYSRRQLQRLLGIGHVTVVSSDPSHPQFRFKDIGDPQRVSDLIRQAARAEEIRRRVYRREDV